MWDAALTADEIEAERWSLLPKRLANVNRVYPMIGGTVGEAVQDVWLGGYSLTNSGLDISDGPPISWGSPIIVPQYSTSYGPVLSLPGVQSITATGATPKVTLTF